MNPNSLAQEVARLLADRDERLVLAESCTCGGVAASLGRVPGISNNLCGSAVTYRADLKRRWLGVSKKTIRQRTTESHEVASEMAFGALRTSPEARWSVAVVGHFGPDAPVEKDGLVYICIARRTKKGKIKAKDSVEHKLSAQDRDRRQDEAVSVVLTHLARLLHKKSQREGHVKMGSGKRGRAQKLLG